MTSISSRTWVLGVAMVRSWIICSGSRSATSGPNRDHIQRNKTTTPKKTHHPNTKQKFPVLRQVLLVLGQFVPMLTIIAHADKLFLALILLLLVQSQLFPVLGQLLLVQRQLFLVMRQLFPVLRQVLPLLG